MDIIRDVMKAGVGFLREQVQQASAYLNSFCQCCDSMRWNSSTVSALGDCADNETENWPGRFQPWKSEPNSMGPKLLGTTNSSEKWDSYKYSAQRRLLYTHIHTQNLKVARESAHYPEGCSLGWIRSQQPKALDIRKDSEASPPLLSQAD